MLRSESTSFLLRGAVAVALGIVAIAWPGVTVSALIVLFAIYVFCDAIGHFHRATASDRSGSAAGSIALGVLDIAAGVVALVWPAMTVFVLTIWLGVWAVVTGVVEVGAAFTMPARRGVRTGMVLVGLASIVFGIVVFTHPSIGVLSVTLLFGLFLLVYGVDLVTTGVRMRRRGATGGDALGGGWTDSTPYPGSARRADQAAPRYR
ncbi:HdeD family acid-resistance protein [Pseudofrankia inefficax]|uniref:HdeD family acid-resistance protein n=1 Tax=Pseudofrankia inefficax (strain DSM 45817 / CECT 9037 / DDB 130130 / EuI1c) TaxID=298654 RepID=E3J296_PSEI1|nr:HdeD family acid-resistance protein [Pseudofrankia inefficax]ADP78134.1 protein of unknown function DUF308 membrane [Pseudofrankia inefficax]